MKRKKLAYISTLPDTFFFVIFVIEIYVGKYAENDGEVRIWGLDFVSKLSGNEVRYFKFTVPIMKIDASKASLPILRHNLEVRERNPNRRF
jgi:hypothetical protein